MSTFPGIMRRIRSRRHAYDPKRLPAVYRTRKVSMSRIAAAGVLRLALRWPAFTIILIFSMVAARLIMSGRRHERAEIPPLPRAL